MEIDPDLIAGNIEYFCYDELNGDVLIDLGLNYYDPGSTVEYSFTYIPYIPPVEFVETERGPRKITSLDAMKM